MAVFAVKPKVGHVLAERYELERVIGEGGMGTVFAARHIELGDTVAVKVLHPCEVSDDESHERFLREARLAARIKNEHVVRVLDVARSASSPDLGPDEEFPPYIVMEYLDGIDLAELLEARGKLPVTDAVDYVLQACEGLVEAHKLGIVHRDLKPSNLLLTKRADDSPLVKILDFGISKMAVEDNSKVTTTGEVFGSPAYMSPEQIRSAKSVDGRADVWALAVVLFEIIAGALPFEGETAPAMLAAVAADPPLPLERFAEVPPGLRQAIERCLVKDRDRRIGSIVDMAASLAPFASEAGRVSAESVRRIALTVRTPLSSSPTLGAWLPTGTDRSPRMHSLQPLTTSSSPVALVPSPPGSDRGVEMAASPPSPRTSVWAALVAFGAGASLIVATWAFHDRAQHRGEAPSTEASWPVAPSLPAAAATTLPAPNNASGGAAGEPTAIASSASATPARASFNSSSSNSGASPRRSIQPVPSPSTPRSGGTPQ